MAPRSRRKFYPEFYTEEELANIENAASTNADENNEKEELHNMETESDIQVNAAEPEINISEPAESADINVEERNENNPPKVYTASKSESEPIEPLYEISQFAEVPNTESNILNNSDVPETMPLPPPATDSNRASLARKTTPKSDGNGRNGTNITRSNGNGSRNMSAARNTNTGERRNANKKVDLKDIDKAMPDNIKEKLYGPAGEKTNAVLRRLDDMHHDYISQKITTAKTELPNEPASENQNNLNESDIINTIAMTNATEETAANEYNDYPFEDEPYKMMDVAAMVMSGNAAPYNDSPYETTANIENIDETGETVEVMSHEEEPYEEHEMPEKIEVNTAENNIPHVPTVPNIPQERSKTLEPEIKEIPQKSPIDTTQLNRGVSQNIILFNVQNALKYAHRWALDRNPEYLDFDDLGGDCTNYVSQILFAGGCPMDKTPVLGWYYIDGNNKSPSWTGAEQLYKYLVREKEFGIIAHEIDLHDVEAGDIAQLSFNGKIFQHTPFIVGVARNAGVSVSYDKIKICAHSFDSENRPLDTYKWRNIRFIRVLGYR